MEDVSTNINLLVGEGIVQKNCPWSWQCSEVGDRVQVMDHHICQSPHLRWTWDCIHGWLFRCTTKYLHHLLSQSQSIFILDWDWLRGRTNLQKFLNAIPCNHKFFVPHLVIYTVSFHNSIWEKFSYDLWVDNPNRVQQPGPSPFFEHLRDEGVLKGF